MQSLLQKLEESTQNSLTMVHSQLGGIVEQMTTKIGTLSAEMMSTAHSVTTHSEQASAEFLRRAEESSAASASQMQTILSAMSERSEEFRQAGKVLMDAQEQVKMTLTESGGALVKLRDAGREINSFTQQLVMQANIMRDAGEANRKTAEKLAQVADVLRIATERQQEELSKYQGKIEEFGKVMSGLDENIAGIMRATSDGLRDYNAKVGQNFQSIVDAANKLVPQATQLLQGQVEQFADSLEDFNEMLTKAKSNGRG
jgi:ABC-type transporter Mla subunit MlaD